MAVQQVFSLDPHHDFIVFLILQNQGIIPGSQTGTRTSRARRNGPIGLHPSNVAYQTTAQLFEVPNGPHQCGNLPRQAYLESISQICLNRIQDSAYPVFNLPTQKVGKPINEIVVSHNLLPQIMILPCHLNDLSSDRPVLLDQLHCPVIKGITLKRQSQLVN